MEEIKRPVIDRTGWPSGQWDKEPDYEVWRSPTGYPCIARRNGLGAWCGYVGVPPLHPWHGRGAYGEDEQDSLDASVHGGVTYTDKCRPDIGVCHVPEPGESDDFWWLGFDTAHGGDFAPGMPALSVFPEAGYKDLAYVHRSCERLAEQARSASDVRFK